MKPVAALSRSIDTLQRNPVIVGILFAFSLLSTVASTVQMIHPLLIYLAMGVIYLGLPFLIGGLVAMVADGLTGRSSVDQFVSGGRSNYVGLFIGGLALGAVMLILYFVVGIAFVVFAAFVFGIGAAGGLGTTTLLVVAVFALVAFLVVLLPWFLTQFFPAAMVISGDGVADAFRRSLRLVRSEFLSIVGFDALAFLVGLVAQIPTMYVFYTVFQSGAFMAQAQTGAAVTVFDLMSTTQLALFFGSSLVAGTVVGSIMYTYYVAFYDELCSFTADATGPVSAD